ncbi:succinyl-diaminopimelate desuccinylase [Rhodococcus rhodochrous]|uniref:hypothetical protein n=1 Tax=Rhodococcus rhodochrous TaxID=1829 RepID=UPI000750F165|nr:hypothetical protein [Rhodococcus rhodochrous]MDO1485123.1 hypothetical protein [Rhodococcus rhodochrous]SNV09946.1 succinyl-diaminopimelate desuccinylase [Rhodococcus rhodochrous]
MTAPGRTDLDADPVAADDIRAALRASTAVPAPRGGELAAASLLRDWIADRWPDLQPTVEQVGESGANLLCRSGSDTGNELLLYSHLDTSLTGLGRRDRLVTGHRRDAPTGLRETDGTVAGFGLGVARGPAAAALVGFAAAVRRLRAEDVPHRLTLLLAGGGTHRNLPDARGASGIRHHLARHPRPTAAVVAKGGPDGLLYEEPGALYLRVRITAPRSVVLARDHARPPGGLPAHIGPVCAAVERWRRDVVRGPGSRVGQIAREAGIGAVECGSPEKPDLLPAALDVHVYLVTVHGDRVDDLTAALRRTIVSELAGGPLQKCGVEVTVGPADPAGATSPHARVVQLAGRAWARHSGTAPPPVQGWTGSTDGSVLRAAGIDTVRTGPVAVPDPEDGDLDAVHVADLVRFARIYADTAAEWARHPGTAPAATAPDGEDERAENR